MSGRMTRFTTLSRYCIAFTLAGAIVGALIGAIRGSRVAAANDYWSDAPRLARWVLIDSTTSGVLQGAMWALIVIAFVLIAAAILWVFMRDWRRAFLGAALAAPVLVSYLFAAWWINRFVLPGALTPPSILGNLALAGAAFGLWYAALGRLRRTRIGSTFERPAAWLRPAPLIAIALAVLAVQTTRVIAKPQPQGDSPNILVIVIDALRPDRLGTYGHKRDTSPNLDRFAAESWVFTNAISTAPWTKPAVASLLTGLYPRNHGVESAEWNLGEGGEGAATVSALSRRLTTLPEIVAENGYRTAAFGENHHLIAELGFDQGFEVHELDLMDLGWRETLARRLRIGLGGRDQKRNTARRINERFFEWLPDGANPWFAYLHHIDVHWPYGAPAPLAGRYGPRRTNVDFNSPQFYEAYGPERDDAETPLELDPALMQDLSDAYDEGVRFMDEQLGSLFAELKRRGHYEGALIVVTADHGEQFMEHGEIGHGTSLHDVLLRVPLMIKFPCPGPYCDPRVIDEAAQLVDLTPTILDVVELQPPPGIAGRSLLQPAPGGRVLFAEKGEQVALRTNEFKFIYNLEDSRAELYALRSDPGERNNVVDQEPQLASAFRDRIFQWLEESEQAAHAPREEVAADEAMLERLKALGYVK